MGQKQNQEMSSATLFRMHLVRNLSFLILLMSPSVDLLHPLSLSSSSASPVPFIKLPHCAFVA